MTALAYRCVPIRALDLRAVVETDHPGVGRYLDAAFAALATGEEPDHVLSLITRGVGAPALEVDGTRVGEGVAPAQLLPTLMSTLNRMVADGETARLLLHASAVERDGWACLFPAPMESGKSTLAAGLARAGYRYVTDEAAALHPVDLRVDPYPRPLSIDRGSWSALADLRPAVSADVAPYVTEQWHVSPFAIRADAVASRSTPAVIAFPRYDAARRTVARRVTPSTALVGLVAAAFHLDRFGARGFAALGELAQRCAAYDLTIGDLAAACRAVDRMVAARGSGAPAPPVVAVAEPETGEGEVAAGSGAETETRVRRRPGVSWIALDRVVVYDPLDGACVRLNRTGSLLWQCVDGAVSLHALAEEVADAFTAPSDAVEQTVLAWARRLRRLGLLAAA